MSLTHRLTTGGGIFLVLLTAVHSFAGGPLILRAPGAPFLWPNGGRMIPFNPDRGALGSLTSAEAVAQTAAAFAAWEDVATATATHVNRGFLPEDVTLDNFEAYFFPVAPDGLSAIVYDADGAIFDALFGPDSGVLGFAGPEWIDEATGEIVEGAAFMNGGALLGTDPFPIDEMLSVQVHEFGHYQNLAHTVVNGQIPTGDHSGPSPFNAFPLESLVNRIETMYPFLYIDGGMATPHADDIAIFSKLYPEPAFATTTGTITGRIVGPNNRTPLTGVNVIARNVANPYDDAVSAISSDFTDNFSGRRPFVGEYTLPGLTPGASYVVYIDEIIEGGFSTPPRILPSPEEFYNGAGESNDPATDAPEAFVAIHARRGVTVRDVDIILNRLPTPTIPLGDDSSQEIFLQFGFDFGGQRYESVWVNANGSLTFGTGSAAFTETVAGLLTGPPRIAALWDDLVPQLVPDAVTFADTRDSLTVTFTNVPEFPGVGANTFTVTLFDDRRGGDDGFNLTYGEVSILDGLAGFSLGGRLTSGFELEADLSAAARFARVPLGGNDRTAVFELFTTDNDLDGARLRFESPDRPRDRFEPNDSPVRGAQDEGGGDDDGDDDDGRRGQVRLPFNTANRFSHIAPGDVDFFHFRARAGDILAIETLPGLTALDTVVGLFDAAGTLLAVNDDGGAGLLSRLLLQVVVDGTYSIGVSTFPDFAFTGAGEDAGRYVLNVSSYRGAVLPFEPDTISGDAPGIEVGLSTFVFPFQGTSWSSLFVNSNGNLTFGAANDDFSETVNDLLNGPPRIAPLWDDLNPAFGLVVAEEKERRLEIHFVSVPEFLATGSNYFTVRLDRRGDITIDYGATNRSGAIVGITEGGGAADPGPIDLSRAWRVSATGTTYEQFGPASFATYGGVDLSFRKIRFDNRR